jgi:predicted nucleotide-binding protein
LVVPYLLGVQPEELDGPLVQFQVATATYRDTRKLVETLNRALGDQGLSSDLLDRVFERMWPMLAHDLERISGNSGAASHQRSEGTSMAVPTIARRLASLSNTDHQLLASIVKAISGAPAAVPEAAPQDSSRDTVFVVHGHDHGTMEKTARFIERLGAEAIVLHERPNEGRTVIEKFELHSNTKYAVVLLTADDTGGTKNGSREQQLPRARQNVILELGYFLAKLGRNRVCVLLEEGVEQPSDVAGVIYISLDRHDAWKWLLARELKTAGIGVDLNKAL